MMQTEAFEQFRRGLAYLRDQYPDQALPYIQKAAELEMQNPFYQSYLGVVLARVGDGRKEAEQLCSEALRMRRNEPQLYLNLAEVHAISGRRDEAVEILQQGMKFARRDFRLRLMLCRMTNRRRPVLPFLGRGHFLNRHLGRWRHRALLRFGTA